MAESNAAPAVNVPALIDDIMRGTRLLQSAVAGYSAIERCLDASHPDPAPAPRFEWTAPYNGVPVTVVTDLNLLPVDAQRSFLEVLSRLHARQLAEAAEMLERASGPLAKAVRQSLQE